MQRGGGGFQKVNCKETDRATEKVTCRGECHGNVLLDVHDQSSTASRKLGRGARGSILSPHPPFRVLSGH